MERELILRAPPSKEYKLALSETLLRPVQCLTPLLGTSSSEPIVFETKSDEEYEIFLIFLSWLQRKDSIIGLLSKDRYFIGLAMLADKYDVPILRDELGMWYAHKAIVCKAGSSWRRFTWACENVKEVDVDKPRAPATIEYHIQTGESLPPRFADQSSCPDHGEVCQLSAVQTGHYFGNPTDDYITAAQLHMDVMLEALVEVTMRSMGTERKKRRQFFEQLSQVNPKVANQWALRYFEHAM